MTPSQLSRELRLGDAPDLQRRRGILGLSFFGAAMGVVVSAYQTGVIHRLPDLPGNLWDANKVDASDYGYKRAQTPDGLGMLATYAFTAVLAGAGGERRASSMPWLPLAMGAKLVSDVATNMVLAREEWAENKALCVYCQAANVASTLSLALAIPEVARAARRLLGRG